VLAGVVLDASSDSLQLSSFDYEVSARVDVSADIDEPGRVLVSGRLLADIARSLPGQPVVMQTDGTRVAITCGRSTFALPTLPVEDYPQLPAMPGVAGSVASDVFAAAVAQVAVAAGRDDTLPTLTGVRMEIDGSTIVLAATDRYRLAVREFLWTPTTSSIAATALVPAKTLSDAAKSLAGGDTVSIALTPDAEGLIGFEGEGRRTTTRLLDGEFPKYRSLLPNESSTVASIDTQALMDAVKRVALVAERNTPVRLTFDGSEVSLRAGAGDDAQASEVVESVTEGDAIEIAFNPGYLIDGLSAINAPVARFSFTQSTRPAVITGVSDIGAASSDEYRYLLMPVRLTG
jgi:DNA polymerase-3 subunit beta